MQLMEEESKKEHHQTVAMSDVNFSIVSVELESYNSSEHNLSFNANDVAATSPI